MPTDISYKDSGTRVSFHLCRTDTAAQYRIDKFVNNNKRKKKVEKHLAIRLKALVNADRNRTHYMISERN